MGVLLCVCRTMAAMQCAAVTNGSQVVFTCSPRSSWPTSRNGTFLVNVTTTAGNGNCAGSSTKVVTVTIIPQPTITIKALFNNATVCARASTANVSYMVNSSSTANLAVVVMSLTKNVSCNISGSSTSE